MENPKVYTEEDLVSFGTYIMILNNSVIRKHTKIPPLTKESGPELVDYLIEKWKEQAKDT